MKQFRLVDVEDHISEEGLSSGSRLAPAGSVLVLTRGMTLLNDLPICVVLNPMAFNQDVKALEAMDGLRPEFLPYLLLAHKERLLASVDLAGHGTGRLNTDELKDLEIDLPSLDEQKRIAHILGTLDDKIELNRQMNKTLEEMARALFKSWFVDFDPVRAKMSGRWTRTTPLPGLPTSLFDLFPDHLVDSALGEIPAGWSVVQMNEICSQITKGTTPTQADLESSSSEFECVNFVRVNCLGDDGSIDVGNLTSIPISVHRGVLRRSILQAGDILYSIAGTIGRAVTVEAALLPANTNQAIAIIRPMASVPPAFLAMTMGQNVFRETLHSGIVHAVQANLSLGTISRAKVVLPPQHELPEMFIPIDQLVRQIAINRSECGVLAELRETLLFRLLNSKPDVVDFD